MRTVNVQSGQGMAWEESMGRLRSLLTLTMAVVLAVLYGRAITAQPQDKYTLQVPNGLAFSEFRGYEDWQTVAVSLIEAHNVMKVILANPVMIKAYRDGIPGNGKLFPDGSKTAKIEWRPKKITEPPFSAGTPGTVPDVLTKVEFIEKDTARFPDTHGWAYAEFAYDAASGKFTPSVNDAKCGYVCHTIAAASDYIFTAYARR